MTADPYKASAGAGDPGSWNRYAYVEGDPVNFNDPAGLASCWVEEWAPDGQGAKVRCQSQSGTQNSETVWYSVSGISTANKDMVEKDARTTIGRRLDLAEASEYLGRALAKAHEAMKDPECRKLFGTNLVDPITGGTLDPDIVLNGLVHGAHGSITYVESLGEGITAQTQGSGLRFSGLSPYYQKANVTIAMDLWNLGFAQENTTTLLHELGHVMNKLTAGFGSSNAFEEYDGISPGASARNTQLVQDSCIRKLQF